jgi:hypothetical protein
MEPAYMNENRYSHLTGIYRPPASAVYVPETPEGAFQQHVQQQYLQGQANLQREEYGLALQAFQEAMALILRTVHPAMPVDPNQIRRFRFPADASLLDTLTAKAADMLLKTPDVRMTFPTTMVGTQPVVSAQAATALKPLTDTGLHVTSFHAQASDAVASALDAASRKDWAGALQFYDAALKVAPQTEAGIRGGLLHDQAVLQEKAQNPAKAVDLGQASIKAFTDAKDTGAQAQALATTAGIAARSGKAQQAADLSKQLDAIRTTTNLHDVLRLAEVVPVKSATIGLTGLGVRAGTTALVAHAPGGLGDGAALAVAAPVAAAPAAFSLSQDAPELMGLRFLAQSVPQKSLTLAGGLGNVSIVLDNNAAANAGAFLKSLAETKDVALLRDWLTPTQFVAYIPHMYFFLIPMAIGDCHLGMGNLDQARQSYAGVLPYPYINKNFEIVKVWTRLAQALLELGDRAYRSARDDATGFAAAKAWYENIVLADKTLNAGSPLYADAKFAPIKARVTAFLAAADPAAVNDNPAVLSIVADALGKLQQIQAGQNFFGFGPNYAPPFGFEYLQNTARYLAQQASQAEQRYVQFKSQAENEQFRQDQLAQQAEVARQSVILEQRGLAEARRGIDVANAGLGYATTQLQGAVAAKNDFQRARWEDLELAEAEAWAGAAAVDQKDEVKLTWSGHYYNSTNRRRSQVLQDLAYQRTRLSQDLEAARLDHEAASARAYQNVARAQLNDALARQAVAQQRVKVAQLQQRQAEENRDFLDAREFGAGLWFDLSRQARRLAQRYLDMATEVAFLMERAYNAETERGLRVIRYDYRPTESASLLGADQLLADVDTFTFDLVTTTRTKKNPVKRTVSLADSYPSAFEALKSTGICRFETALADFDRAQPGLYLAKIRNVEVVFVGVTQATSISGTLRNVGVSRFRGSDGQVIERLYPADVMVLSQYDLRQDALAFRFNPNDLRLFENNGLETLWELRLPPSANDLDFGDLLDVHLTLYYDGFYDTNLEAAVLAALPAKGSASRAFSTSLSFPDELFYLKNQGQAELVFDDSMFPRNQKDFVRTRTTLKLAGDPATVKGLTVRLKPGAGAGAEVVVKTDANGLARDSDANSPLKAFANKPLLDTWEVRIAAADNPQLVRGGALNLDGLGDLLVFSEYTFNYR